MFDIVLHKNFYRKLKDMEKPFLHKLDELFERMKRKPIPWKEFDIRKIKGEENTYRVRIGKYRIIYFIDKRNKRIHILKIEKRRKAYKR